MMNETRTRNVGAHARRDARGLGHIYLLTADESTLTELEAAMQAVPYCARGRVFIEVDTGADISVIDAPTRMTVTWLTRQTRSGAPGSGAACATGEAMSRAVNAWSDEMLYASTDTPHIWLGGHYRGVSAVHEHLVADLGVNPERIVTPEPYRLSS
ncbi:SIP domain-containing protein [Paramicrobacterium fandaimingii]|uniref:SIP domain-containing protein n=1 Tax=Paramicrobacterium fandaimingii TaxID=2708079 RepID=UPI001F362174|nr:SIP domain-containing protein [Microbacterium fandaimingii]